MSFETLKENVTAIWGEEAQKWLTNLNSIIETLAQRWRLTEIVPVQNMSYNFVAFVKHNRNILVVDNGDPSERLLLADKLYSNYPINSTSFKI